MGADELKRGSRQRHDFRDCGRIDDVFEECNSMGDDGNGSALCIGGLDAPMRVRQEVFGLELLRCKDEVDCSGRQAPLSMKKVGEMGLSKVGLPGEEGHAE